MFTEKSKLNEFDSDTDDDLMDVVPENQTLEDDAEPVNFFQQTDYLALFADSEKTFDELLAAV